MVAAGNAALRCSDISASCSEKFTVALAEREFRDLEEWLESDHARALPLHELEEEQEKRMREVNRLMLQAHIQARGTGNVASAIEVQDPHEPKVVRFHCHRRIHDRRMITIFGGIRVTRQAYSTRGHDSIHPLDEDLSLPERSFSYSLQRRLVKAAIQGPFDEAVQRVEEDTNVAVPKRSAEQIVQEAAEDFGAFYEIRKATAPSKTGEILVGAVDGKGIPMVKPKSERPRRRQRGPKPNKKKMATVAAVFTQVPRIRTPKDVVESLFEPDIQRQKKRPKVPGPEDKRVWASLKKSKDEVITEAAEEMNRRDPRKNKTWVVVADGERALQNRLQRHLPPFLILVLDFLHVLERLWKTAYAFHPEGSDEAKQWVRERALRILQGKVSQVVKGLRQSCTKRRLRGDAKRTVEKNASYFYKNRKFMRYHQYLKDGLPIASGAVEGACKNLIKDRMERSGMRWTEDMAEAMVQLRAIDRSGDWQEYWAFHFNRDQQRIHPQNRWKPVVEK